MKLKRPRIKISALIALSLILAAPCHAKIFHTIEEGESLATLAQHYYGDPAKATLLKAYNQVSQPRHVRPGQRITIPEVTVHRVRRGDTLARLAKRYLNDTRKSWGLAKLNHIEDPKSLSPGTAIVIPVELQYTVRRGDSLSSIAKKYCGDAKAFRLIALYNEIKDPLQLEPGTRLILPIQDLKIIRRNRPAAPVVQPKPKSPATSGESLLDEGVRDYFMGDYLGAVKNLQEAVRLGLPGNEDTCKAHRFLAYAFVALNEPEQAKDSFRKALQVDPELILDPVYVSPKIITLFEEVKKERDSGARNQEPE